MCKRLAGEGLLEPATGRGLVLTTAGRAAADAIFRRHALLEWLLTAVVGLTWAESDVEAMRLQGALSPRVESKLDELLGHPETCPHGNPIDLETTRRRPAGIAALADGVGLEGDGAADHRGGRGGRGPAVLPRGAGAGPGRARHGAGPVRVARLADARGPARPRVARACGRRRSSACCPARPTRRCSTRSRRRSAADPALPTIGAWPPTSASASRPAPPARSTSAPRGPRCSTTCSPAAPAARSSSASRTRTSPAARPSSRRTSSTACTGWASTGTRARRWGSGARSGPTRRTARWRACPTTPPRPCRCSRRTPPTPATARPRSSRRTAGPRRPRRRRRGTSAAARR